MSAIDCFSCGEALPPRMLIALLISSSPPPLRSQEKYSRPAARNASSLGVGMDGIALLEPGSRRVAGEWGLPTGYLHDSILTDEGTLLVGVNERRE